MAIDLPGLEEAVVLRRGHAEYAAYGWPAAGDHAGHVLHDTRAHGGVGGGEAGHVMALGASQELVDRHVEAAGHEVVQCDVDCRDGGGEHAAAFEVLAPVHLLPQRADSAGILAQQELPVVAHRCGNGKLPPHEAGLAPAVVAGVGLDLHDAEIPPTAPEGHRLDFGDLHCPLPAPEIRRCAATILHYAASVGAPVDVRRPVVHGIPSRLQPGASGTEVSNSGHHAHRGRQGSGDRTSTVRPTHRRRRPAPLLG